MFKIVRVQREKNEPRLTSLLLGAGALGTLTFGATILTYNDFFLFNPLDSTDPIRKFFLVLTTMGWTISLLGPILVLLFNALGKSGAIRVLPWVALAWPVSLILNHSALLIQTHKLYLGYLGVYPIFIVTDIALPLFYLAVARFLASTMKKTHVGFNHGQENSQKS